ncbi:hypothetical protein DOE76_10985 [Leifsonia sp. ku-ls]|nr:hypothetical protein DOE76_10985 [Leifsonia sp. ku-ls]
MVSNSIRLPRLSGVQRIVVLLLAVTGIVTGLLAMHTLTTVTGDHSAHHAVATTHDDSGIAAAGATTHRAAMVSDADTEMSHGAGDCNGSCQSGHNMANMVCLLALLALTLVLTLRVIFTRWGNDLHRLVAALAAALPATLAPPSPPSLHVLSISRT